MKFRLESYGVGNERVLRYLNGNIIKESPIQHFFTVTNNENKDENIEEDTNNQNNNNEITSSKEENIELSDEFLSKLHELNCENWHLIGTNICMSTTLRYEKENPLEWDESMKDQQMGYASLSKIKSTFDHLNETKKLKLLHTVNRFDSQTLKYSIFDRNASLDECSSKSLELSQTIYNGINLQNEFINVLLELKKEFKLLMSHRNPVDLTSLDVDFPSSFALNVLFYDISYYPFSIRLPNLNTDTDDNQKDAETGPREEYIWDIWLYHSDSSPFVPQICTIYYNNMTADDMAKEFKELNNINNVKMVFPMGISHFIEKNYGLCVNGSSIPLYERDESNLLLYHLRRGRNCLIDRHIFLTIAQMCFDLNNKTSDLDGVKILFIGSDGVRLELMGRRVEIGYKPVEEVEAGEVMWKLVIAKMRSVHIQNWKQQKYQLDNNIPNIFEETVKFIQNLINFKK
ncbi:hypothetical protein TpMuguga_04g00310 [Theileria parva strain Muguga]|uniref:Uncharacterized protein n=1 Tax=Theileria parva TaxID=5875 RepID=Q4N2N8_THEPA|nr:uncharacterized protein TpMuguga_04g00310 [Theileria parva strain Muguga]EAN31662.1 hypothetical protein TpMuguga_04g00310 [Theileria parva strain Muguga]|eukprot:XP_763945.1 hypothetical protein [Theileria parva strain Muguga]